MDLPHVAKGQPPPLRSAGRVNAVIDAARANRQQDFSTKPQTFPTSFPRDQNTQILVRNDSNFEFDRWAVVGLDDPVFPTADDGVATESYMAEPVFSVRPPESCRHWGRWAVLVQPLNPGEVGRAVMAGGVSTFVDLETDWPRTTIARVDIELTLTGEEYHTTQYGRRRRDGLKENADGSAQVLWAGREFAHESYANLCSGSVDIECEPGGTAYMITRDSCGEGCSAWAAIDGYAVPCTPGVEHLNLACYGVTGDSSIPHRFGDSNPGDLALVRLGNASTNVTVSLGCGCSALACRSECVEDTCANQCTYTSVADGGSPTGWTWTLATPGCVDPCRCQTIDELVADAGYPAGSGVAIATDCSRANSDWFWTVVSNACHPTAAPTTSTSFDPSSTTTTGDPSTTTTTTAAPGCTCPDLNVLQATWPELYPCGPNEPVKFQTHFCYTTTTTTSTTTSTTSTSTEDPTTTTSSTSTTSTSTEEPTTTSSTSTEEPTTTTSTTEEPCPGTCDADCYWVSLGCTVIIMGGDCPYYDAASSPDGCFCAWGYHLAVCNPLDFEHCTTHPGTYPCVRVPPTSDPTTTLEPTTTTSGEPTSSTTTSEEPTSTTSGEPSSTTTSAGPTSSTSSGEPTSSTTTSAGPTSSTTSEEPTSTTTTTAAPGCSGSCDYLCVAGAWQVTSNNCVGEMNCVCADIISGCGNGETTNTNCVTN